MEVGIWNVLYSCASNNTSAPGSVRVQLHKAKKLGLVAKRESDRTPWQSLVYYCREFDAVGLLLLSAGIALFVVPFNLYTFQAKGWESPLIICLLVFGIVLTLTFAVWERFFAPVTFIPYSIFPPH